MTKPVVGSTSAGYTIHKFTDSIGTLYAKVEYGTASTALVFSTWITWGTGTNGAGTITGILSARTQSGGSAAATSLTTPAPSYGCCVNGAFWIMIGTGINTNVNQNSACDFGIHRTCDSSGAITADGYESWSINNGILTTYAVNLSTLNVLTSAAGGHCLVPYSLSSSNYGTGGNNVFQVWRHEIPLPQTFTANSICSYIISEIGTATTFVFAVAGLTTHTFIFSGGAVSHGANNLAAFGLGLIYE